MKNGNKNPRLFRAGSSQLSGWLKRMKNTRYDWRGVFGWLVNMNNTEKFYCFEAAQEALYSAGCISSRKRKLSGCDLREMAKSAIRYGKFGDLA